MSVGLWCIGVELGGGGRWRGEGQVETGHADGPGAVKGGREAWTEGPERLKVPKWLEGVNSLIKFSTTKLRQGG